MKILFECGQCKECKLKVGAEYNKELQKILEMLNLNSEAYKIINFLINHNREGKWHLSNWGNENEDEA